MSLSPAHFNLQPLHTTQPPPSSFPFNFTVPPVTDLWLKPAPFDAPSNASPLITVTQPSFVASVPLGFFLKASVTVSFKPVQLYDQAGLVIVWPEDSNKWIKAGLEYTDGEPKRSSVVTTGDGRGADWTVAPPTANTTLPDSRVRTTVEFERENGNGTSLIVKIGGEETREVTWVFAKGHGQTKDRVIKVGFYGARPADKIAGNLDVLVEKFELITK